MKLLYTPDAGLDLVSGGGYDDKPYIADYQTRVKMSTGFHGLTKINKKIVDYDDIESVWGFAFETKKPYEETYAVRRERIEAALSELDEAKSASQSPNMVAANDHKPEPPKVSRTK